MSQLLSRVARTCDNRTSVLSARGNFLTVFRKSDGAHNQVIALGGAASAPFGGAVARELTREAASVLARSVESQHRNVAHPPLMCHSSYGTLVDTEVLAESLASFAPRPHAWTVNFQLDGTSAVHAACDIMGGGVVAVCQTRYHGPPSTAVGSPLSATRYVYYPAVEQVFSSSSRRPLLEFLDAHSDCVTTVVIEPQWGSSRLALPWDRELLAWFVQEIQSRGMRVCMDEVMCGMGRHGGRDLMLATSCQLAPNAIVVGKGLGGGLFPLAAAIVREDSVVCETPLQRHTYSDANALAMRIGTIALPHFEAQHRNVKRCARLVRQHLLPFCERHRLACQGQGLLWGIRWNGRMSDLQRACFDARVAPYFVASGLMLTPPIDIEPAVLHEGIDRLKRAMESLLY